MKHIKKIRYIVLGKGNECPKCSESMERRGHKERPIKTWYYEKWDYCWRCKHLQHYEEFKSANWRESELRNNFFRNI